MQLNDYKVNGKFTPSFYRIQSMDKKIKEYHIHFPEELRNDDRKYPVIIAANGVVEPSKIYYHALKHLASWGFIVVSNQDNDSWTGYSTIANLKFLLELNENTNSPFYQKVDIENIGVLGHSEGGIAAINAINNFECGKYFKTLYTASMPNICLMKIMGWKYNLEKINIPYCMVQGTGFMDSYFFIPKFFAMRNYKKVSNDICKIEARCIHAGHNNMLWDVYSGYTAWFMWQLQNNKDAEKIFAGNDAKILTNKDWTDVCKNF